VNWRVYVAAKRVAGGWSLVSTIRWFDASSTLITTASSTSAAIPSDGNWWTLSQDFTAPANAAFAQIDYTLTATAASSTLQLDTVLLYQVLPQQSITISDATASSQLVIREIVVPRLMTVYRVLADGSKTVVRGSSGLLSQVTTTDDTLIVTDYEAPLGVPFSYRVEFYNSTTGVLTGYRTTGTYTLDPGDPNYIWIKDPARPLVNMRVLVKSPPDWQQPIEQNVLRPRGRPNAVVLSGVRAGREGSLVVWTQTDDERDALRFLLATGNILFWQSAPGMGEPDVYVSVAETAYPRVSEEARDPWREWTLPLTEVDRPTGGMAGSPTWTVRDVGIENSSVLSLMDRYATVLDLALGQRSGS